MSVPDAKSNVSLWLLTVPVAAWGLHFLAVYVVTSVHCAKNATLEAAASAPVGAVRWLVIAITLTTLAIDALAAWRAQAAAQARAPKPPGQDRFLGSIVLLVCALSAAGMIWVAAVVFVFGDCRQ
jgi:hypothetical protein